MNSKLLPFQEENKILLNMMYFRYQLFHFIINSKLFSLPLLTEKYFILVAKGKEDNLEPTVRCLSF
jgi:hypothetical protein